MSAAGEKPKKENLIAQLEHTRNNYILGLAAYALFISKEAWPILEGQQAQFGPYTVNFNQVAGLMKHEKDRDIALNEFFKMLMRTLITEGFEHIKDYCEETDQYAAFKRKPWYEFARLIRNFLSHNCIFEFNKYDRARLPIKLRDVEITVDMHKKDIPRTYFGEVETWELFQDFETFLIEELE